MGTSSSRRSTAAASSEAAGNEGEASEASSEWIGPEGVAQGYEELVNAIIRPPRMQYNPAKDLGPAEFRHCGKRFLREDVELTNNRKMKMQCSWWKFNPEDAPAPQLPVVIYLHGNAACRIAAIELLKHLLNSAVTVFAVDFTGSGLSEGEHVSLGYFEREDVEAAIAHLRASGEVSTVGLWGHSMGATTALLYGDRDPTIAAMVLDSPFTDLMALANELANNAREQGLRVPGFAISMAAGLIRRSVRRRAKFDPKDVAPIQNCGKCFIPALFAHGEKDIFIKPHHSEQLHAAYAGDKNLILFDGDHNSERPDFFFDSAVIFLRQTLGVKDEHCLDVNASRSGSDTFGQGDSLFNNGARALRRTEEEMMRQAMMLSIQQGVQPAAAVTVPQEVLQQAVQSFQAVTGVGGDTAMYYVYAALSQGEPVDFAIQQYFDNDCTQAPAGWRPPAS
uniref:Serine aminopeptidase S33 domain-containing protein n=1 Tax=Alexandrium catenella TaxID=2925 RepID=A0A7S1RDN9_ALECA|mmetsp:Transcript_53922/g.144425  ORF Transcript_53922/g.144425 Transcript_53922/m.144425 type:complete len:450 (+) Transcript_53922:126-1475(+)